MSSTASIDDAPISPGQPYDLALEVDRTTPSLLTLIRNDLE